MNILDIAQNSVRANATLVEIELCENTATNQLTLLVCDNGSGMDEAMVQRVTDPFFTTRTTRDVGLGIPFLKMAAEMTGGNFTIQSEVGKGTTTRATFTLGHIDLMPLGDMGSTMSALSGANPTMDFVLRYQINSDAFVFDTREARAILEGVPLSEPSVTLFVRDHVNEGIKAVQAASDD